MIRVAVSGAAGRMGREVVRAILAEPDMTLAAAFDLVSTDADAGALAGLSPCGVTIGALSADALKAAQADVLVDFSAPSSAAANATAALTAGAAAVIGTTGLTAQDMAQIEQTVERLETPALIVPNFALGAVLMMRFAADAARYMPDVEIIELHHDGKLDAPSGTARLTAERIARARPNGWASNRHEEPAPARGDSVCGIPVHSVRLPGLVAHQEVILGALGQTLTIRHDSTDRRSFMPGVLLAVRHVRRLSGVVVGLDRLLDNASESPPS